MYKYTVKTIECIRCVPILWGIGKGEVGTDERKTEKFRSGTKKIEKIRKLRIRRRVVKWYTCIYLLCKNFKLLKLYYF